MSILYGKNGNFYQNVLEILAVLVYIIRRYNIRGFP